VKSIEGGNVQVPSLLNLLAVSIPCAQHIPLEQSKGVERNSQEQAEFSRGSRGS
jgi:hypothetical protein